MPPMQSITLPDGQVMRHTAGDGDSPDDRLRREWALKALGANVKRGGSAGWVYASGAGCSMNSAATGGGADDTTALQAILAMGNPLNTVLDGVALVSGALSLSSNKSLTGLTLGGGTFLAAASNCAMVQNANLVSGATPYTTIVDKHLCLGDFSGYANGSNQSHDTGSGANNQWTFGLRFHGVEDLHLRNIRIVDSITFSICGSNLDGFLWENIIVDNNVGLINTDGPHLNGPARRGTIKNISVATGDDGLAIMADDGVVSPYVAGGDITDINVDGIFCRGSLSAVRMGSATHLLDRVHIRNISGSVTLYGGIMNAVDPALTTGAFGEWSIHGVNLDLPTNDNTHGVWEISATHQIITFGAITRRETSCARSYWHLLSAATVREFNIDGFSSYENGINNAANCQMYIEGAVGILNLSHITWENSSALAVDAAFIKFGAGGSIGKLIVGAGVDVPRLFDSADAAKIGQIIGDYPKTLYAASFAGLNGTTAANYTPERGPKGSMLSGAGTLTGNTLAIPSAANPLFSQPFGAITPNFLFTTYFTYSGNQGQFWFVTDPASSANGMLIQVLTDSLVISKMVASVLTGLATLTLSAATGTVHKFTCRAEAGTLTITMNDTNSASAAIPAALLPIKGVLMGNASADVSFQKTTLLKI